MATTGQTIVRTDKDSGARSTVTRAKALELLAANHGVADVAPLLDAATESHPAETPFALYWPVATAERTAGEAIANAVSSFHLGLVTQAELAKSIDDALKAYR